MADGSESSDVAWDRLAAEREALRTRLVATLRALDARAADPLGLMEAVRRHPYVAAGGAAAAGAVLVNLLAPPQGGEPPANGDRAPSDGVSVLIDALRDAAVRAVSPFIVDFVTAQLGAVAVDGPDDRESSRV